nr:EOG090X0CFU [Sida crystallina]
MHVHGKIASAAFLTTLVSQLVLHQFLFVHIRLEPGNEADSITGFGRLLLITAINLPLCFAVAWKFCASPTFQVAWRAQLLGAIFMIGVLIIVEQLTLFSSLGWYICIMAFFHFSEFLVTSLIRPQNLSTDSFLLNHSKAYGIAALVSWLEYLVELCIIPTLKGLYWPSIIGIALCIGGEIIRKVAMLTAGSNFDHLIRLNREEKHQLVTSGIYSWCRHPSYVGWFYWSVGTQLVLCNPLCTLAYSLVSWRFFSERIFEEEITLLNFFGDDYEAYQQTVPTGLPFIRGYVAD